ncbi:MAG: Maf family protein [Burkholderiaceae bacterium]
MIESVPPATFVYLASQSPRRRELLEQLHIPHELLAPHGDEDVEALERRLGNESPRTYVRRVTRLKAEAAVRRLASRTLPVAPILVGDTTVAIDQEILAKPADADDARRILAALSGRAHRVLTAVVVVGQGRMEEALSESRVRFRTLTPADIDAYITSGEPFGRAGAYAIQGRGAAFVERISGSHSGIVGLPLYETIQLLHRFGIQPQ